MGVTAETPGVTAETPGVTMPAVAYTWDACVELTYDTKRWITYALDDIMYYHCQPYPQHAYVHGPLANCWL